MHESASHNPELSREQHTQNVISLAWQNLLKRWALDVDTPLDELRQLMIEEIYTDSQATNIQTNSFSFLSGTTRKDDNIEYQLFCDGTLTDLHDSYIIKNNIITVSARKAPTEAPVETNHTPEDG